MALGLARLLPHHADAVAARPGYHGARYGQRTGDDYVEVGAHFITPDAFIINYLVLGAPRAQELMKAWGAALGRAQVFDGHTLVVGDSEFFAFRDGQPLWHWKAPNDVNATAFAAMGLGLQVLQGAVRTVVTTGGAPPVGLPLFASALAVALAARIGGARVTTTGTAWVSDAHDLHD